MGDEKRALALLKKIPLLSFLPLDTRERLAGKVEIHEVPRRRVIYLPGDPGETVYFIATGRVKISKVTQDGKELTLAYYEAGELLGEFCLIDGSPRQNMAEAAESSALLELDRKEFAAIFADHPQAAWDLIKILAVRRRDIENKIEQLIFRDVGSKLAELLLDLSREHGVKHNGGILLSTKITHQEMANIIGSTRETVSLALAQFKKKGLITNEGRKLILVDKEGLYSMAP